MGGSPLLSLAVSHSSQQPIPEHLSLPARHQYLVLTQSLVLTVPLSTQVLGVMDLEATLGSVALSDPTCSLGP